MNNPKVLTLCILHNRTHILLGMKKRGFGEGLWNGFGGKLEDGETIEGATSREVFEETGVRVQKLKEVGVLNFCFIENNEHLEVHVFDCLKWVGEPVETDEMVPKWFLLEQIPYDLMWPDDKFWLPLFLDGKKFRGAFSFDSQNNIIKNNVVIDRGQ